MSPDAPLRAWLALGAVFAVGATAIVIRPEAAPPRAAASPAVTAAAVLEARPFPFGSALPTVRPVSSAVRRAVVPAVRQRAARADVAAAAAPSIVPVPSAASPAASVADVRPSEPLPARLLGAWDTAAVARGRMAAPLDAGWAPRAGLAVARGFGAAGDGIRAGLSAAAGALRRQD